MEAIFVLMKLTISVENVRKWISPVDNRLDEEEKYCISNESRKKCGVFQHVTDPIWIRYSWVALIRTIISEKVINYFSFSSPNRIWINYPDLCIKIDAIFQ